MPFFRAFAICLLAILLHPMNTSASEESYRIQTQLGAIEGWRVAPEAILRYCNRIDPANDGTRRVRYEVWIDDNRELIAGIDRRFYELVPLFPLPHSGADPIAFVKARLIMDILRSTFLEKTPDEQSAYCQSYTDSHFPWFDNSRLERVHAAIAILDEWSKEHDRTH
ncbi:MULTISPECIES: hypothetical protein [unclassified Janthinobacterium]|uniref:hypothetical protein n=1 Tax=unclassified Janthinobacterium TaxID=2610881 RepID=UPI00117A0449|nr:MULTISPECIES: hypothetical protein [unclassified Janthinobacterium]MED5612929.1 hypothetical protein [Janthinobacterium sp. P210005]